MNIIKWFKKYETERYRFVTYADDKQKLIVDDGDILNPIDVMTADDASCFGHQYIVELKKCIDIKDSKISLLKAKRLTKRNDLFNKYQEFVTKVKTVEKEQGVEFKGL